MIDIHTHILPGIDDGSEDEAEALEFARVALEDGTRTVVATPHCKEGFHVNDRDAVVAAVAAFREVLARERLDLEILPGAEVHLCPDLVDRVRDGRAPTLADNGTTLLLELSLRQHPVELENLVFQLKLAGIEVVFAHPERIRYFREEPRRYAEMVRLGAWGQINAGSIRGIFGDDIREYAEALVRDGLVHAIASDAHNVRGRHPRLSDVVEQVAGWVGETRARAMVTSVPQALIEGRAPDVPPVEAASRRSAGGFWSRWFGRRGSEAAGRER